MEVDEQSGNPSIDESKIIKRGILNKKGRRKLFRPWTLRTIIIDDQDKLLYFKGSVLKGEVMLKDIHVRHLPPEKADGKKFAFEISNIPSDSPLRSDSLLLAAATEAEAADWVDIISSIVFKKSSSKTNFEYESFQAVAKNNPAPSLNLKKLKQQRLQQLREKEMAEQADESDDDEEEENDTVDENTKVNNLIIQPTKS